MFQLSNFQYHICDVCRLLDYDTSKKWCGYCGLCDAFICEADRTAVARRIKAAAKRMLEPGYSGRKDYLEFAQKEGLLNESSSNS
jgi:hypothetical protein